MLCFYANAIVFVATNLFLIALLYNDIWLFNIFLFQVINTRLLISFLLLADIVDGDSDKA